MKKAKCLKLFYARTIKYLILSGAVACLLKIPSRLIKRLIWCVCILHTQSIAVTNQNGVHPVISHIAVPSGPQGNAATEIGKDLLAAKEKEEIHLKEFVKSALQTGNTKFFEPNFLYLIIFWWLAMLWIFIPNQIINSSLLQKVIPRWSYTTEDRDHEGRLQTNITCLDPSGTPDFYSV